MSPTLSQVRSFAYIIGGSNLPSDEVASAIGASPVDLVVLSGYSYGQPLKRALADPRGDKLIFGYLDVGEATAFWEPELFPNGAPVSWLGKPMPGFPGLYSVQYWQPEWRPILYGLIDKLIAAGWDGIFLDVPTGMQWMPGNILGNPVNPDATLEMSKLLADIGAYVDAKTAGRPFYLMLNGGADVVKAYPASVAKMDAALWEVLYYGHDRVDFTKPGVYAGTANADQAKALAPAYAAAGLQMIGLDYAPLNDPVALLNMFSFYSALGWLPSVNNTLQDGRILTSGPLMFMANAANQSVQGSDTLYSYLSGGVQANATLTAGAAGGTMLGGPGRNVITGAAAADEIYAHPEQAGLKNTVELKIQTSFVGVDGAPVLTIKVNGQVAQTLAFPSGSMVVQTIRVETSGSLNSLQLEASGLKFVDQSHLSNALLLSAAWQGVNIALGQASLTNASAVSNGILFNNGAAASFSAGAFPASPFLADTSSAIDGKGGVDTVHYRRAAADYTITGAADGSFTVTALKSAEGPDKLISIEKLAFADKMIALPSAQLSLAVFNILREQPFATPIAAQMESVAGGVLAGTLDNTRAIGEVVKLAGATTSVATLAYQFFTGKIPGAPGYDYLVSPTGPNPNNLNSTYYQSFNLENRYINFAVNLGKVGEGNAKFSTEYGGLTLAEATKKAYGQIFGATPTDAKVDALLASGRDHYFESYGRDGLGGLGTKAAMVGWLLAEAVKADVGMYARANDAFLTDLADGAAYAVDLVGVYGKSEYAYGGG